MIQSNIIGSIIHDTFQILYENFKDDTIDLESYNNILETEFNKSFQEALNKNNFPNGLPESGFNYLSKEMINMMINNFIKYEQAFLKDNSFKILGLETLYDDYFDIDGIKVHLTGRIDRIDQVGDMIRILDYKTGSINSSDVTVNKNIDTLSALSPKALQLIIYKYLYSKKNNNIDITNISQNDLATLRWLYKFPVGKSEREILSMYSNYQATSIDDLVLKMTSEGYQSDFEKTKNSLLKSTQTKDLLEENQNIGDLKKYLMQLNNLNINIKKPR